MTNQEIYGFDQRKATKLSKIDDHIKKRSNNIVKECVNSINSSKDINKDKFDDLVHEAYTAMNIEFSDNTNFLIKAFNYLLGELNKIDTLRSNAKIRIPKKFTVNRSINKHFKNFSWYKDTSFLASWKDNWEQKYLFNNDFNLDNEFLLSSILISASFNGALCYIEGVTSLYNVLNSTKKPLIELDGRYFINLKLNSLKFSHNDRFKDVNNTIKRWFPDLFTLSLINNYLHNRKKLKQKISEDTCWRRIHKLIYSTCNELSSTVSIDNHYRYFKAASGVLESCFGKMLNQSLINLSLARIPNSSLCDKSLITVFTKKLPKKIHSLNDLVPDDSIQQDKNYENIKDLTKGLLLVVKKYDHKGNKVSAKAAIKKLKKWAYSKPNYQQFVAEWSIQLLESGQCVVSSVNTYMSNFAGLWFKHVNNKDIDNLTGAEFDEIYVSMFNDKRNQKRSPPETLNIHIKSFHRFLVNEYGYPQITYDEFNSNSIAFTRANFVSHEMYNRILNNLSQTGLNPDHIYLYSVIIIIAYRTGIRIGELQKMKFRDIELSEELILTIASNEKGDNKTPSANRKIHLSILLNPEELRYVRKYINQKFALCSERLASLVFSYDINKHYTFDSNRLTTIFSLCLKSDYKVRFHDLRHTALTRLHFILEDDKYLIKKLTDYSDSQIIRIQRFYNHKSKHYLDQLAKVAGHSSPESTFKHYIHLADLVLHNKLMSVDLNLNTKNFISISGVSRFMINKTLKTKTIKMEFINNDGIRKILNKSLNPYSISLDLYRKKLYSEFSNLISKCDPNLYSSKISFLMTCSAINEVLQGNKPINLAKKYDIPVQVIDRWLFNAFMCLEIKNKKGYSRLISKEHYGLTKYNPGEPYGYNILPTEPKIYSEKISAQKIFNEIQKLWRKDKVLVINAINILLNSTTRTSSYIKLSKPQDLTTVITFLIKISIKQKNITAYFTPLMVERNKTLNKTEQKELWQDSIKKGVSNAISGLNKTNSIKLIDTTLNMAQKFKYPQGKIELFVCRPVKEKAKPVKSRALIYSAHLAAINLFSESSFEINGKEIHPSYIRLIKHSE